MSCLVKPSTFFNKQTTEVMENFNVSCDVRRTALLRHTLDARMMPGNLLLVMNLACKPFTDEDVGLILACNNALCA